MQKRTKAFEDEILHTAIVECYMQLSRATRQEDDINDAELLKEESRLRKLSNIVLVDYVKGMCELLYSQVKKKILNQKSETPESEFDSSQVS